MSVEMTCNVCGFRADESVFYRHECADEFKRDIAALQSELATLKASSVMRVTFRIQTNAAH